MSQDLVFSILLYACMHKLSTIFPLYCHSLMKFNWRSGRIISVSYFLIYLNGWGKYVTTKCRAKFFNNLIPIQQKGQRVPITLQEKVDGEIDKVTKQGHIE